MLSVLRSFKTVRSKADDLWDENRRSSEPKQTIFWAKADDPTKADDPWKYKIDWNQTILVEADDPFSIDFCVLKRTIFNIGFCMKADDPFSIDFCVLKRTIFNISFWLKADDPLWPIGSSAFSPLDRPLWAGSSALTHRSSALAQKIVCFRPGSSAFILFRIVCFRPFGSSAFDRTRSNFPSRYHYFQNQICCCLSFSAVRLYRLCEICVSL